MLLPQLHRHRQQRVDGRFEVAPGPERALAAGHEQARAGFFDQPRERVERSAGQVSRRNVF